MSVAFLMFRTQRDALAMTSVNLPAPFLVTGKGEAAPRGNSEQ